MDSPRTQSDTTSKHCAMKRFLKIKHSFLQPGFDPSEDTFRYLHTDSKVLVIGAGGLGCEILKCLTLSGFGVIHIIDMDIVDLSNLNRQFLFRESDIGKPKATVAAEFINHRFGHLGVHVVSHVGTIQEKPIEFYAQFNVVVAGLDNVESRRWINSLLHSIVKRDPATGEIDSSTIIPFFDGGTEGLRGQSRTILPFMTSCFECSLGTFPSKTTYPLCTIAETPRIPEHCIEYVFLIQWPLEFPDRKADADDPEILQWITMKANERAQAYGIEGVTEMLAMGVIKRIVPAVASTNALIAAMLVSETLKISTYCGPVLNSYLMFMGQTGVYTYTFPYARNEECLVCAETTSRIKVSKSMTLEGLIEKLRKDPAFQLQRPSLSNQSGILFIQNPPALRQQHEYKLSMTIDSLILSGDITIGEALIVTDPVIPNPLRLELHFK